MPIFLAFLFSIVWFFTSIMLLGFMLEIWPVLFLLGVYLIYRERNRAHEERMSRKSSNEEVVGPSKVC